MEASAKSCNGKGPFIALCCRSWPPSLAYSLDSYTPQSTIPIVLLVSIWAGGRPTCSPPIAGRTVIHRFCLAHICITIVLEHTVAGRRRSAQSTIQRQHHALTLPQLFWKQIKGNDAQRQGAPMGARGQLSDLGFVHSLPVMAIFGHICTCGFMYSVGRLLDRVTDSAAYKEPKVQKMTGITGLFEP